MKIDILSDLHIDFYFKNNPNKDSIYTLYKNTLGTGDILIVAGDLGHYNIQNLHVLRLIKEVFKYKYIICVLGNHDYYLVDYSNKTNYKQNSLNRIQEMRNLINKEEGMYCLDGNIVEINGVKFGGCDSWYDGEYTLRYFSKKFLSNSYLSLLYRMTMADADYVYGIKWLKYAKEQKKKIEDIYKEANVMITHVNPSIEKEHQNKKYQNEDITGFFTFDGSHFLKNGSMKFWIFGHTHERIEYETLGVKCLCNPMGYPNESFRGENIQPMQIDI